MNTIKSKRIDNLEFRSATYLLPKENWPEHIAYHINYYYPNCYYGKESEFIKDGDWYVYPDNRYARIHKDCFKHKQSCFAIAGFEYNIHEGVYDFKFIGDRPVELTKEERDIFWDLIKYGFDVLNNINEDE